MSKLMLEEVKEDVLYHYTKSNGINGIMNKNCFWATKSDFLNDPNEFSYIYKVMKNVCRDFIHDEEVINKFVSDVRKISDEENEYFVLSFSCCRDSITMWAEFGNSNGYNIGFDSSKIIDRIVRDNAVEYNGLVTYNKDKQNRIVSDIIIKLIKEKSNFIDIIKRGEKNPEDEEYTEACKAFQKEISVYSMFFKDPAFSQEKEYRFIFTEKESTKLKFRVKDGYIIPYIEVQLSSDKLPVSEIVVAPQNHIDLAKKGMDYMMKALDYEVPVTLSDIKLRY